MKAVVNIHISAICNERAYIDRPLSQNDDDDLPYLSQVKVKQLLEEKNRERLIEPFVTSIFSLSLSCYE